MQAYHAHAVDCTATLVGHVTRRIVLHVLPGQWSVLQVSCLLHSMLLWLVCETEHVAFTLVSIVQYNVPLVSILRQHTPISLL